MSYLDKKLIKHFNISSLISLSNVSNIQRFNLKSGDFFKSKKLSLALIKSNFQTTDFFCLRIVFWDLVDSYYIESNFLNEDEVEILELAPTRLSSCLGV